jgi:hypothetical protein
MVAIKTANLLHRSKKGDRLYLIFMNIAIGLLFIILVYSMYLAMNMCSPGATGANVCQQINVEVPDPSDVITAEETLAKCLTQEGAVMYGTFWCGHCKNQKRLFGDAFKYVAYIECTENQDICTERGITSYPTWIIDGEAHIGEMSLQVLADMTGCEYLY